VITRLQIVTERSKIESQGCEQRSHRLNRLAGCEQPYSFHLKRVGVGAAWIEPVPLMISTQQSAAAPRSNQLTILDYSCGYWYTRKIAVRMDPAKSRLFSTG